METRTGRDIKGEKLVESFSEGRLQLSRPLVFTQASASTGKWKLCHLPCRHMVGARGVSSSPEIWHPLDFDEKSTCHLCPCGKQMQITPDVQVRYQVSA